MNSSKSARAGRPWRIGWFLAAQCLVIAALVCTGAWGSREFRREWRVLPLREQPLNIRPLYDCSEVISDEHLRQALLKLRPRLHGPQTLLADVDHALRCWGPDATFDDPEFVSGAELRKLLTDSRSFAGLYGAKQPPAMFDTPFGVCCRVKEGIASTSHTDHSLACLAEVGTPLSFPLYTSHPTTYRAMVEQALHDFNPCQIEYEWSAKTFALFLPPVTRWPSTEGQTLSFDLLADRIMREEWPRGVCYGTHRLYGLAAYLRLDDELHILSRGMRERIVQFLKDANKLLLASQDREGFWNGSWPFAPSADTKAKPDPDAEMRARIIVTGHVLEYWAMAPKQLQPPRKTVAAGADWLVRTIDTLSETDVRRYFSFLSHAVRALSLWRGHEPFEALKSLPPIATGS